MRKMIQSGSLWFNRRLVMGAFIGAVVAVVGLRASANIAVDVAGAGASPLAESNELADGFELSLAAQAPVVRYACCIQAEDRCEYPMVATECKRAGGYLVRGCGQCGILRIADLDPSLQTETDDIQLSTSVAHP